MKKHLIVILALVFFCIPIAWAEECEIPGKAMLWIADYCLHQAETDDFQQPKVQACFEKNQGYKTKDSCANRKKYKMKLCQHLVNKGYYEGTAEMCFDDKEFIPTTVRNGGI